MPIETDNHLPEWRPIPKIGESDMEGDKGVDPDDNAPGGEQPIFRPHAFALSHGKDGAKVAYGQFLWRIDTLIIELSSVAGPSATATVEGAGQDAISGLNVRVPTINSPFGDAMDPAIPNIYHQLVGYGDVYLYWTTDLDAVDAEDNHVPANRVDACWVVVGGDRAEDELDAVDATSSQTGFDRTDTTTGTYCPTADQKAGTYRVKLGTVNEDEEIIQDHSSDVFWSIFLLKRTGGHACTYTPP